MSIDARVESTVEFTRKLVSTDTHVELSEAALAKHLLASNKFSSACFQAQKEQ